MVFSVPLDSVMCAQQRRTAPRPACRRPVRAHCPPPRRSCRETARGMKQYRAVVDSVGPDDHVVALFLMREMAKGAKSDWWPYLKVLPENVPLPAHFRQDELAALQVHARTHAGPQCRPRRVTAPRAGRTTTSRTRPFRSGGSSRKNSTDCSSLLKSCSAARRALRGGSGRQRCMMVHLSHHTMNAATPPSLTHTPLRPLRVSGRVLLGHVAGRLPRAHALGEEVHGSVCRHVQLQAARADARSRLRPPLSALPQGSPRPLLGPCSPLSRRAGSDAMRALPRRRLRTAIFACSPTAPRRPATSCLRTTETTRTPCARVHAGLPSAGAGR